MECCTLSFGTNCKYFFPNCKTRHNHLFINKLQSSKSCQNSLFLDCSFKQNSGQISIFVVGRLHLCSNSYYELINDEFITMDMVDKILEMMLHFTPFAFIVCALLLILRRKDGDKSRIMLAVSFIIWGMLMLGSLVYHYSNAREVEGGVLSIISLHITLFAFFSMILYPMEVIYPGRMTIKNILMLLASNAVFLAIIALTKPEFRELTSLGEIFQYIGEYNVWLRLSVILYILPLSLMIFYIPYRHTRSRVNIRWIRWFCGGMMVSSLLYVIWVLTGSDLIRLFMQIYCMGYCLLITYQELYQRLIVPSSDSNPVSSSVEETHMELIKNSHSSPLWNKLVESLKERSLWRNPDLTLVELATILGTNRTTLSTLIQEAGYDGFYALINTCRIKEFIRIIEHQKIDGIYETFLDVGFRSKVTAIRYFRKETGTTPSVYLQQILLNQQVQ